MVGASVKPTYFRPGTLHKDDGTIHTLPRGSSNGEEATADDDDDDGDEWILIDSTPASCVQIGLYHYFQDRGPVDLVVSGPNYGRNTTALFALSSGTIGAAMEGAVCGKRSIALSYAFSSRNHDPVVIAEASRHSVRLIEYLARNWADGVGLYSINVPLEPGVSGNKTVYTQMLENQWKSGSCFAAIDAAQSGESAELQEHILRDQGEGIAAAQGKSGKEGRVKKPRFEHKHFKWAPKFGDVYRSIDESEPGNDGWVVKAGMTRYAVLFSPFFIHGYSPANACLLSTVSRLLGLISSIPPRLKGRLSCESCSWNKLILLITLLSRWQNYRIPKTWKKWSFASCCLPVLFYMLLLTLFFKDRQF